MILVLGGSGGLGRCVIAALNQPCIDWSRNGDPPVELTERKALDQAALGIRSDIDGIVNCVGVNEIWPFDELEIENVWDTFRVNAYLLAEVVQVLRNWNKLRPGARICNVISNAANLPMTHSLAYNISKAAQQMLTRQMARELREYSIFGVNPNKLANTPMSKHIEQRVLQLRGWTPEQARQYQLAALPAGMETPPFNVARFIAYLMEWQNHPFITGCIFPYGGPQ